MRSTMLVQVSLGLLLMAGCSNPYLRSATAEEIDAAFDQAEAKYGCNTPAADAVTCYTLRKNRAAAHQHGGLAVMPSAEEREKHQGGGSGSGTVYIQGL